MKTQDPELTERNEAGAQPVEPTSTSTERATILPLVDSPEWIRPRHEWKIRLGMILLLGMMFLPNLGAFGLWDPWETHYGEVTRNMVESYDWVSPWWGYRHKIGPTGKQGDYFYSKPVLIFWMEAASVRLIGFSEWAIRLPMALFAMLTAFFAFYVLTKVWGRKTGLIGALIMGTAPQFFLLSRQAQTDMIFVAPLTVGLLFLVLALFGPREGGVSRRNFIAKMVFTVGTFLLSSIPQFLVLATDLNIEKKLDELPLGERIVQTMLNQGVWHAVVYSVMSLGFLVWHFWPIIKGRLWRTDADRDQRDRALRQGYLLVFVTMCGVATLGKGLLGFALPGAILFLFLLVTNTWNVLKEINIPRFLLAFIPVGFPWYVAMFVKHGNAFYTRFIVHDHFNRLGTGVHQIDSGTFEHFLKWLGIGMYPWVAFVPLALVVLSRLRLSHRLRENRVSLFVFIWFFFTFFLFTMAKTKFHHYIFPALPPMAFLIGRILVNTMKEKTILVRVMSVICALLFVGVSYNLVQDEQAFRKLFTYKYDRKLPDHMPTESTALTTELELPTCSSDAECLPGKPCVDGVCRSTWEDSQFYQYSTDTVEWALTQSGLHYDTFVYILAAVGLLGMLLFACARLRWLSVGVMILAGLLQTGWGLSYYLPLISPHWSQKSVFENYYAQCGDKLQHLEQDAYDPLIRKLGMEGLYDYFNATSKRICPYQITSWLIVWRGETYYSYNELIPLEKKNVQLRPYLEETNPTNMNLPAECGGARARCPNKFYVFMENRKSNTSSSISSGVNAEIRNIQKDNPNSAVWKDVQKVDSRQVDFENDFFTLFEVWPVYKTNAGACSCANATLP